MLELRKSLVELEEADEQIRQLAKDSESMSVSNFLQLETWPPPRGGKSRALSPSQRFRWPGHPNKRAQHARINIPAHQRRNGWNGMGRPPWL